MIAFIIFPQVNCDVTHAGSNDTIVTFGKVKLKFYFFFLNKKIMSKNANGNREVFHLYSAVSY